MSYHIWPFYKIYIYITPKINAFINVKKNNCGGIYGYEYGMTVARSYITLGAHMNDDIN